MGLSWAESFELFILRISDYSDGTYIIPVLFHNSDGESSKS